MNAKLLKGAMQKIKTFFRSVFLSCTSPQYYAEILRTNFNFSLKYLFAFQLIFTFVVAMFVLIPASIFNLVGMLNNVKAIYPRDLVIDVQDGRLSINQQLPYKIAIPPMMADRMNNRRGEDAIKNIVVFDSDANIHGAQDVYDENAFAVVTETTMYTREGERQGLKTNPIPADEDIQISPTVVDQAFGKVTGSAFVQQKLYVPLLALFFFIVVLPLMFFGGLIMAAIYGFVIWFMSRVLSTWLMAGNVLSYKKSVQVTIHSLTLINIVHWLLIFSGHGEIMEGTVYLVAFVAWTAFLLFQVFHTKGSRPVATVSRKAAPVKTAASRKPAKAAKKAKK